MANFGNQNVDVKSLLNNNQPSYKTKDHPAKTDISGLVAGKLAAEQAEQLAKSTIGKKEDAYFEPSQTGVERAAMMRSLESAYHYSETMSLSLTTKEGDQVDVNFRQLYTSYQSYKEFQAGEQGPTGVRYFESREALEATSFEEHIGFSVQGELSEEELQAIYDVFEKVDALANHFFNGDIEKAFENAVALDVDFSQIDSLSLNLTQTEMKVMQYKQAAMAEYQRAQRESAEAPEQAGMAADNAEEHIAEVGDLPDYLQNWQEAIASLDSFFERANEVVSDMVGEVAAQRFPDQDSRQSWLGRVREFHERLAERLSSQTLETSQPDTEQKTDVDG